MLFLAVVYIDPGTGSIALQLIIAGVVGSIAVFRQFFARVVGAVFRRRPPGHDTKP